MLIYIAGPMRGKPEFNFPAFYDAETELRLEGHDVVSPARHDEENGFHPTGTTGNEDLASLGFDLTETLLWDLQQVAAADGIYLLDGHENSSGARAELALAQALGKNVRYETEPLADWEKELLNPTQEVRTTSETGGQKGSKPQRYDLIPTEPLRLLATLYGRGAEKYDDDNWRKGYDWKFSYAALQRHLNQFWAGEDIDPEMQVPHVINAAWHCFTLAQFMIDHPEYDNRANR